MSMGTEPDWVHWQPADAGTEQVAVRAGQGPAHFVRYRHPGRPCSLITIYVYPAWDSEAPGEYRVAGQVEWVIGTDPDNPDGTAVWSDFGSEGLQVYGSLEEAATAAEEIAAVLAAGDAEAVRAIDPGLAEDALDWDGLLPGVTAAADPHDDPDYGGPEEYWLGDVVVHQPSDEGEFWLSQTPRLMGS